MNTVAWAPYEYGLMLACGSSDGSVSILSSTGRQLVSIDYREGKFMILGDGRWTTKKISDCHPVRKTLLCNK